MRTLFTTIFCLMIAVNGAFAQNAIVTENQVPGNPASEWDLSGPGSTTLQGFTTTSASTMALRSILRFNRARITGGSTFTGLVTIRGMARV